MYRKRRAEESPQSPSKRARGAYFPQTPVFSSSSPICGKNAFATPRTPYTPYPLRPSDSPSNPFGRKRIRRLIQSLPPTTSFSKHIALRFQFVQRSSNISPRQGGVYRIVQVPLNYTLVHLKCLIAFLFNTPASYHRNGTINGTNDDHLFEVKSKVTMYSPLYKPGQIRSGHTTVKLSNVRDPCRWRSQYGYGNDSEEDELDNSEGDGEEMSEDGDEVGPEEEQDDWKWEDEEDYTLGHVWPGGLDIHRGLIYHHSRSTQVHISVNTIKLPRRRGSSKTPYVFKARGRVHLSPPLPRPIFSKLEITKLLPRKSTLPKPLPPKRLVRSTKPTTPPSMEQELTDTDSDDIEVDANKAFNLSSPFYQSQRRKHGNVLVEDSDDGGQEDEDEQEDPPLEDPNTELNNDKWNEPAHAFGIYLLEYMGHPASDIDHIIQDDKPVVDPFDDDDDDDNNIIPQDNESPENKDEIDEDEEALKLESMLSSSPGLTHRYSSSSSQAPSSPFPPTSSPSHDFFLLRSPSVAESIFPDVEAFSLEQHYPNTKYANTPAPPKERTHRRRIERVQKRMEKMKRQGWLCARDESASDEEQKNEVDELAGDDNGAQEKWVKQELKEGEIWDPFGDELEV